jgi:hypothetical protein
LNDLLDPTSKAHKSLRLVRSMHKRAGVMMNSKYPLDRVDFRPELLESSEQLKPADVDPSQVHSSNEPKTLWVNQWDMLLTQWAFIGPMLLEPQAFGVHGHSIESLELVMYLWRAIGHFIGIHPKFNLFHDCDYTLGVARCKKILERVYSPALTQLLAPQGARMSFAIVKGMRYYSPYVSWSSIMKRSYELFNIDAKKINKLMRAEFGRSEDRKQDEAGGKAVKEQGRADCDENGNQLNSEDRLQKLLAAGYHDRYEVLVWDGLPVERVKLHSTRDQIMDSLMRFQINYSFKWQPMRSFSRNANMYRQKRAQENRQKLSKSCSESYDDRWQFDKCPFSAAIGSVEYEDFSLVLNHAEPGKHAQ